MPPKITLKSLQTELAQIAAQLEATKQLVDAQLAEATQMIVDKDAELEAALAAQPAAAQPAAEPLAMPNGIENADEPLIPKPRVPRGQRIKIQRDMGLFNDNRAYRRIQHSLRILVHRCELNWEKDFRLQDPEKMALLYRKARKEHPILKRYQNNWATTELVKMYLQNVRANAREEGYLAPAAPRRNGRIRQPGTRRARRAARA